MPNSSTRPKLSICITTYNRRHMLTECLESVLPTAVDCEVAVFDDASTDGTAELLAEYAARDPRIRVFRQPANVGASVNLATALREARGEYMSQLSDDDSVVPGNYEKKLAILEAHPEVDFVYSLCYLVDERGQEPSIYGRPEYMDYSYIGGRDEFVDLICGNYVPGISAVFRRKLYDERGGYDENVPSELSDWDLWLRYTHGTQTAFINEPLVNVRFNTGGLSAQKSTDAPAGVMAIWRKWLVEREDPPVLDSRAWEGMQEYLGRVAQQNNPGQPDKFQEYAHAFEQLRKDAAVHASRHFARTARSFPLPDPGSQMPTSSLPALAWSGPVLASSDEGIDVRGCVLAAERAGLRVRLENVPIASTGQLPLSESETFVRKMWTAVDSGNYLQVCQSAPRYFDRPADACASVGRTLWLTDRLPDSWVEACNHLDAIWALNQFQCETFGRSGVDARKLRMLPGCIDLARYGPGAAAGSLGTGRSFNFLAVLPWAASSGWDVLIRAFVQVFRPDEDVALMILAQPAPGQEQESLVNDIQQVIGSQVGSRPTPVISLQLGVFPEPQLASLLRASQAYAHPRRAASWDRSVMQAMASGLPIIATAWGGTTELVTEHNGYPVECQLVGVPHGALPELPNATGHRWAEPSQEHLQARLREVLTNREQAAARGEQAHADVAAKHDPAVVGAKLREFVAELASN